MQVETANDPSTAAFSRAVDRLVNLSIDNYYNPYRQFDWVDSIGDDAWWMSPSLMTIHGTELETELSEAQRKLLSKWESINFYSLNVHGIRELMNAVIDRIHTPGYEVPSEFFHHFVGEENEHMWFFAHFCLKYGGKLYPDRQVKFDSQLDPEVETFLVFARITIFEEIVDYFNARMGKDRSLAETIQQINEMHHVDESRHIAFGRKLLTLLYDRLRASRSPEELREIEAYLRRYMVASMRQFYSVEVYRDAGLDQPFKLRQRLLADPRRAELDELALKRTTGFLVAQGILDDTPIFLQ